jgi:hypothetical protein
MVDDESDHGFYSEVVTSFGKSWIFYFTYKMLLEHFVPTHYYWWASVAFFGATIVLSAAIWLREDRHPTRSPQMRNEGSGHD